MKTFREQGCAESMYKGKLNGERIKKEQEN